MLYYVFTEVVFFYLTIMFSESTGSYKDCIIHLFLNVNCFPSFLDVLLLNSQNMIQPTAEQG